MEGTEKKVVYSVYLRGPFLFGNKGMVAYKVAMEKLRTTEKIFNRRNTFHSWLKRLDFQKDNYPKEKWSSTSGGVGGESGVSLLRGVPWYNNQVFQGDTSLSFFLFGGNLLEEIFLEEDHWKVRFSPAIVDTMAIPTPLPGEPSESDYLVHDPEHSFNNRT